MVNEKLRLSQIPELRQRGRALEIDAMRIRRCDCEGRSHVPCGATTAERDFIGPLYGSADLKAGAERKQNLTTALNGVQASALKD
jgi:hypothetical protein